MKQHSRVGLQPLEMTEEELRPSNVFLDENPIQSGVKLRIFLPGNIAKRWFVIVETYDHKRYGKGKREYLKTFTEKERKAISHWYRILYNWYLISGTPDEISLRIETINLLDRAANFFATI